MAPVRCTDRHSLANTLCHKWGYGTDIETFKKEASNKFSLLKDGTLDKPTCARLLLVNVSFLCSSFICPKPRLTNTKGTEDEIFPIDDSYLALLHGPVKEAR
jgi:hypothetical protein